MHVVECLQDDDLPLRKLNEAYERPVLVCVLDNKDVGEQSLGDGAIRKDLISSFFRLEAERYRWMMIGCLSRTI